HWRSAKLRARRWWVGAVASKSASSPSRNTAVHVFSRLRCSHAGAAMTSRSDAPPGAHEARRITSLQNETVKSLRALHMRKARRERGLFLAEGAGMLMRARDSGWRPRTLL